MCAFVILTAFSLGATSHASLAGEHIIDEMRFGGMASVQGDENGAAFSGNVFFDPFNRGDTPSLMESLMHPRPFIGAEAGFGKMNNQAYGGLAWTFDVTDRIFAEVGFGGVVHDGAINDKGRNGPDLGCRVLFREHAALGYRLDSKWSLIGQIEHASNANLCDPNDGMSHAGLQVGYRF
ncbi:acyloxyacyl hydrolase [Allorhizobium undicola]|uniref:acyloxyacyl hydrolase n=1 Tax=Allorhizobium undicola TaxID=78527 RepID=UPI003D34E20E